MNKKKNNRPKALHLWLLLLAAALPGIAGLFTGIFVFGFDDFDFDFESLLGGLIFPYVLFVELLTGGVDRSLEGNLILIMGMILVGLWAYSVVISKADEATRQWSVLAYAVLAISVICTVYYCWFLSTFTLSLD